MLSLYFSRRSAPALRPSLLAQPHLGLVPVINNRDALAGVDLVLSNTMPVEVPDAPYGVGGTIYVNLVTLHDLLHSRSDVTEAHVNPGVLYPSLRRLLDGLEQVVVLVVESHCEGAVYNPAVNLGSKVNLANVALLENGVVAAVGGVVGGDVVETATGWEADPPLEPLLLDELPVLLLKLRRAWRGARSCEQSEEEGCQHIALPVASLQP